MFKPRIAGWALVCVCLFSLALAAQKPQQPQQAQQAAQQAQQAAVAEPEAPRVVLQAESTASVLRLMKFSGALRDPAGNPRAGAVGLTFALYRDQQGGAPLWLETHNAQLDEQGHYTVLLGSTKSDGLPLELFSTGEARWLGVQLNLPGEEEQPRVLLVSVPYALKAADAETLGGKPPSAFLLADPVGADLRVRPDAGKEAVREGPPREGVVGPINGEGTIDTLAKFTGANSIGNAGIVEVSGKVGIGTATPNVKLSLGTDLTAQKLALYDGPGDFYGLGLGSGRIAFHTSNTEKMTLTSGGRLGIGTVAPNVKLSLGTDLTAQKLALYDGPGDFYGLGLGSGRIAFHTSNTEKMTLTSGGRLGIGTVAPNVKLSLGTDVAAQKLALYDGASDFYGLGLEAGRIVFHTGNTEKMTLTAGGNLGVGTGTPGQKLTVAGTIESTSGGFKFPDGGTQTSVPRMFVSAFLPGDLVAPPWTAAKFVPDNDISVTRLTVGLKTPAQPACGVATIRLTDGTVGEDIVLPSGQTSFDTGPHSLNFPAGANVEIKLRTGAVCGGATNPANANVLVQYKMRGPGEPSTCPSSFQLCSGICDNVALDPSNCGSCGVACSANNIAPSCASGLCTGVCNSGFADCNANKLTDGCETNIATSVNNCGGCGLICSSSNITPSCSGGACTGTCNSGFADCNANKLTDGCETNTATSVNNCGGCGLICSSNNITPSCAGGTCTGACNSGFADCNANKQTDGCEINTATNVNNCGGCGVACSVNHITRSCTGGACTGTCDAGFADCNANKQTDGCETNIATNPNNCGACFVSCNPGEFCVSGVCVL